MQKQWALLLLIAIGLAACQSGTQTTLVGQASEYDFLPEPPQPPTPPAQSDDEPPSEYDFLPPPPRPPTPPPPQQDEEPNQPPQVTITSPSSDVTITSGDQLFLESSAIDDGTVTQVEYYVDGNRVGAYTAAPYRHRFTQTAASTYSVTARVTDNDGLSTTSSPVTITVQPAPDPNNVPVIRLSATTNSNTAPTTITLTAVATDADSDDTLTVSFYRENEQIMTDATAPYTATYIASTGGSYQFSAIVSDGQAQAQDSAAVSIQEPNQPPIISSLDVTASSSTAPSTLSLYAIASDTDGTVTKVDFLVNQQLVSTDDSSPFQATYIANSEGTYQVTARATDDDGATTSLNTLVSISAINNPPTGQLILTPADSFAPTTIHALADLVDPDGDALTVEFYSNDAFERRERVEPWEATIDAINPGIYGIKAVVTDEKGGDITLYKEISILEAPNQNPVMNWSLTSESTYAPTTILLQIAGYDADGDDLTFEVVGLTQETPLPPSGYSLEVNAANSGTYTYQVIVRDENGGEVSQTRSITIDEQPNNPPTVTLSGSANSEYAPADVIINAQTSDPDGDEVTVKFYQNDVLVDQQSSTYSLSKELQAAGSYVFYAVATDSRGASSTSQDVVFTLQDPVIPTLPECSDGIDNDGDRKVDYPRDKDCSSAWDETEEGSKGAGGPGKNKQCKPRFVCDDWTACYEDTQYRFCVDVNGCENGYTEQRSCTSTTQATMLFSGVERDMSLVSTSENTYRGDLSGAQDFSLEIEGASSSQVVVESTDGSVQTLSRQADGTYTPTQKAQQAVSNTPAPVKVPPMNSQNILYILFALLVTGTLAGVELRLRHKHKARESKVREYIKRNHEHGRDAIHNKLVGAGWDAHLVDKALDDWFAK